MHRPRRSTVWSLPFARLRLRRRRSLMLGALALVALTLAWSGVGRPDASATNTMWGEPVRVARARTDLPLGHVIVAEDVTMASVPGGVVPDRSLGAEAVGRTVVRAIHAGEIVTARRAPSASGRGVAATLAADRRALSVPAGPGVVPVRPGDRVDVLATDDPLVTGRSRPTTTVARRALVVDRGPDAVTVAVTAREARAVAGALARATVTLALAPLPEAGGE